MIKLAAKKKKKCKICKTDKLLYYSIVDKKCLKQVNDKNCEKRGLSA